MDQYVSVIRLSREELFKTRTETSEVSKLRRVVRHCTHEPICSGLPHGVEQTAEDIYPNPAWVVAVREVDEMEAFLCSGRASVVPMFHVRISQYEVCSIQ